MRARAAVVVVFLRLLLFLIGASAVRPSYYCTTYAAFVDGTACRDVKFRRGKPKLGTSRIRFNRMMAFVVV